MAKSESINQELLELEDRIHQQLTSELEMKLDVSAEDGLPNVDELQKHVEGLIDEEKHKQWVEQGKLHPRFAKWQKWSDIE